MLITIIAGFPNGTFGSFLDTLHVNQGIYMIHDSILYIADSLNNHIVLIAPISTTVIATLPNGTDSTPLFENSMLVSITESYIYVLDTSLYQVLKFFKNRMNPVLVGGVPVIVGTFSNTSTIGISFAIFVNGDETLYVSDYGNN